MPRSKPDSLSVSLSLYTTGQHPDRSSSALLPRRENLQNQKNRTTAPPSSSSSPSSTRNIQPTNMMLRISEKKTTYVDLYGPIREYITFNYSGREAEKHDKDLWTLKNLRYQLENPAEQPAPSSRRETLLSYYRSLCVVETLFPISPAKGHINSVTFTWYDAFKKSILKVGNKASQQSIHLEKAAVLFNLGAVYNEIGQSYNRSTAEGRQDAIQAFIAAAGVFAYLKDNAALKASMGGPATVDVSVECARMMERLMLAQAQECVFDNTIAKGSTPGVCAKISRQVGLYYEEALAALKVKPLAGRIDKKWISHVQLKAAFFNAEACYRYGLELHEKDEFGEQIARLKSGISTLKKAKKSSKRGPAELVSAIEMLKANIEADLGNALRDNDEIYHQRVPSPDSLPSLPSFSLVKPKLMNEVLDARDEEMFSGLARRVPVGSESNVYGQSASNLVAGSSWEGTIQEMLEIGGGTWDRETVVHALRAHGNLERAVEYLCLGPKQPEVPPVTRVPPGAQAANPPAQPAQPAQSAPGQLPSAVPQAVTITPEERVAIESLEALGFDPAIAQEVYFACDKNQELAANNLLDHNKHEYKD